jgi:hypothetical protein
MKESAIQQAIVAKIRRVFPRAWIDQNPLSELQISGPDAYRFKLVADLKARGWEPGRPDLIVTVPAYGKGLDVYAFEVKTTKEFPFRPYNGKPKTFWVEETKNQKAKAHVIRQMHYLADLYEKGFTWAGFVHSPEGVIGIINNSLETNAYFLNNKALSYEPLS